MFDSIASTFKANFLILFILLFLGPLYLALGKVLSLAILKLHGMAGDSSSLLYQIFGNIQFLFPFNDKNKEFNTTQILLFGIMLALISLVLMESMAYQAQSEQSQAELKQKVYEELKREQEKEQQKK